MSNVDILGIDAKIKRMFEDNEEKLPQHEEKLIELQKTVKNGALTFRAKKNLNTNIEDIKNKINDIKFSKNLNFYVAETAHLLEQYKKILQTPVRLNFLGRVSKFNTEKTEVISKYLEIAQKYMDIGSIDIETSSKIRKVICNNCPNKKLFDIIDNSIYICIMCGAQQEILLHTSSYKDIDRINISAKYTYDRKVHFRDCINQYQGKQNSTIEPKVYVKLIDQFEKHHLLIKKPSNNTPVNKDNIHIFLKENEHCCKNITKEHIHIFLKELDYTKHYENVNLIHYQLTGTKPDDISHLENRLLDDFDQLTELYDKKFKNKPGFDRKNFINTQYVLYQLLIRYKHICKKEDFTILKTVDRKSFHDEIAKHCFEELEWCHTPLF